MTPNILSLSLSLQAHTHTHIYKCTHTFLLFVLCPSLNFQSNRMVPNKEFSHTLNIHRKLPNIIICFTKRTFVDIMWGHKHNFRFIRQKNKWGPIKESWRPMEQGDLWYVWTWRPIKWGCMEYRELLNVGTYKIWRPGDLWYEGPWNVDVWGPMKWGPMKY